MTLSFIGDGIYLVAVAWQVYSLSNAPTALSLVGLAWVLPQLPLFVVAGVLADRFERRRVLIAADLVRVIAVGAIGALAVAGALELWHIVALVVLLGAGDALFGPAFSAFVPELVVGDLLAQANALDSFVRTLTSRLIGPALGGAVVAGIGTGAAFLFDAATFGASAICLLAMRSRSLPRERAERLAIRADLGEGAAYVRSQPWIWGTLVAASVSLLFWFGPFEVLLPFIVKNDLGGNAGDLGFVLAAGGIGSLIGAFAWGQVGLPRRPILVMALAWASLGIELVAVGLVGAIWQASIALAIGHAVAVPGMIIWMTLLQSEVPPTMLGRVSSLDWLVSTCLLPVSFALTGPVAEAAGVDATVIGGGVLATGAMVGLLAIPGVREIERRRRAAAG